MANKNDGTRLKKAVRDYSLGYGVKNTEIEQGLARLIILDYRHP